MSNRFFNLQKRSDSARIPLNLPLFSKTSLVPPHVHSVEHLFKRPYAVRDCPEKPPTSYIYRCYQPLKRSVKTRRNPLSDNKVYLQMAGRACSRDGLTIQGLETCACCITEVAQPLYKKCLWHRGEERQLVERNTCRKVLLDV
jgi:hypothetical protein